LNFGHISNRTQCIFLLDVYAQHIQPFYGHYAGQPALAGMPSYELMDFIAAKFYCRPRAVADDTVYSD